VTLSLCFTVRILGLVFTGSYYSNSNVASLSIPTDSAVLLVVTAYFWHVNYDDDVCDALALIQLL